MSSSASTKDNKKCSGSGAARESWLYCLPRLGKVRVLVAENDESGLHHFFVPGCVLHSIVALVMLGHRQEQSTITRARNAANNCEQKRHGGVNSTIARSPPSYA